MFSTRLQCVIDIRSSGWVDYFNLRMILGGCIAKSTLIEDDPTQLILMARNRGGRLEVGLTGSKDPQARRRENSLLTRIKGIFDLEHEVGQGARAYNNALMTVPSD